MTEILREQNEQPDPRPIGRFLLGMQDYHGQHDPFSFAAEFAAQPGNFRKYKHKSSTVQMDEPIKIDGRQVTLEFKIDHMAYIWKIIVAAEQRRTDNIHTNYLTHGGERYELHCSIPKSHGKYQEYGAQGTALRQMDFDSEPLLRKLQGIVERIFSNAQN